jgi:serine/threonine-protein kinase
MRWEDIEAALTTAHGEQLPRWREAFSREVHGDPEDLPSFTRWLRDTGRISTPLFRSLHARQVADGPTQADTMMAETTILPSQVGEMDVDAVDLEGDSLPTLLDDGPPFTMQGRLAAGAMGEILIVKERDLRRQVALKRMHPGLATKPRLARRFLHEAQITAQLDHPNIVPVYTLIANGETLPAYTMKLVRGKTFAELITEARDCLDDGRSILDELRLPVLLEHFVRACDALAYAHSRGVVHRDLKPDNIMVGAYGEVYVMDWGIARVMGSREGTEDAVQLGSEQAHRTRFGAVLGTPAYMSPEQAMGHNDQLDGRSDVYALGLILTELVTLRQAAGGKDTRQLVGRMKAGELEPLRHHDATRTLEPALVAIIDRATRTVPMERYPTAAALADDVRRHLRGEPVSALPETPWQRAGRWVVAHRVLALWSLLALLTTAGGVTITSLGSTLYTVRAASYREAVFAELQAEVASRGRALDARFQTLPVLLQALSTGALQALALPSTPEGPEGDYYLDIRSAPDLGPSEAYGRPISLDHPNTVLPLEVSFEDQRPALRRLATLGPTFRRTLVAAHEGDLSSMPRSRRLATLREEQSPVRWVYLALASGIGLSYPGHPGVPPGLDLRMEPWYEAAKGAEAVWGDARRTTGRRQTLLPVSKGIFDEDGWRLGAVAIEVALEDVVGDDLALRLRETPTQAFLLDRKGGVLLSTEDGETVEPPRATRWLQHPRYADERIVAAVLARSDGHLEVLADDGRVDLVIWSRMGALGWTYVVRGDRDALLR